MGISKKALSLERRRREAIRLITKHGYTQADAARKAKVHARTVRYWLEVFRKRGDKGLAAVARTGRPAKLTKRQKKGLENLLLKGALACGFSSDLWSCPRVAELIRRQFGIEYHVDHVLKVLRNMGWSPQKPERRAIERDETQIRNWVKYTWPRIKKKPGKSKRHSFSKMKADS